MFGNNQTANPHVSSPAPSFHPEFGYLCPSAAFRRRVRLAAKLVLAAMAFAAGAAFALSSVLLVPRPADQGQRAAPAVVAQVGEESAISQTPPAPSNAAAATVSGPAALARAQASCEDPATSFLSPQCQPARKSHALRAAQEKRRRLAAVPLGHGDTPASAPTPGAAETVPHHAAPGPDKPKPVKTAPVKTAHKHRRDNPDVDVVAGAPPPQPPPAFGLFGLFRDLPRF